MVGKGSEPGLGVSVQGQWWVGYQCERDFRQGRHAPRHRDRELLRAAVPPDHGRVSGTAALQGHLAHKNPPPP